MNLGMKRDIYKIVGKSAFHLASLQANRQKLARLLFNIKNRTL